MFAQYFGQFLLNRSIVTASELDQALSAQAETRVKLGVLAINKGYMTPEQVEQVHQTQTRIDKRFGEIAVDMGHLTEEVVTELLSSQQSAHLTLGQALIDQGTMNYETFSTTLNLYKKDYSLTDDQFESIVNGSIEALVESILSKQNMILGQALTDYISLFAKNMIRFIDSHIRIEIIPTDSAAVYEWTAYQSLVSSDRSCSRITAISATEASFLQLASIYALESIEAPGEMMEASVGELLNLHNGIYLVNLSNRSIELDLEPQAVVRSTAFSPDSPIKAVLRVLGPLVQFDLILTDLSELTKSA
ncbi:hypothetical protein [Paenibacillus sp. FSL H7-0331]|uniref:hypothetical protein n=1 Tax=Paenibacillus sp. FSL H7-0331 TaxID=1920421 RepID=UPI00096D10B2|nr:hypothetical protein [Paenibacillus sp. FSL H7-0331]OMF18172.1 hypothetical protein BK127_10295 [Paenibacillus sp. FSL H7-0331]